MAAVHLILDPAVTFWKPVSVMLTLPQLVLPDDVTTISRPEATPARSSKPATKSLLDRLLSLVRREPEDREGIKAVLEAAHDRQLLDAESYKMIKGALAVSEGTVGDIMVPRSRMDLLDVTQPIPYLVASVIETAHSRFPVYEGDRDNIIGILLAMTSLRRYAGARIRRARWCARPCSSRSPSA